MINKIITLMRGTAAQASEDFGDRHALAILKQQINDCAAAVTASRRAVAIAIAQNEQEANQHHRLINQIGDLENRAMSAMEQGKNELAREAAQSIAFLEAERDASTAAQDQFLTEIYRLKGVVRSAEAKLKELQRGQRLAVATDQTQRLRNDHPSDGLATLKDAEETLLRLRARQQQIDTVNQVMADMEDTANPAAIIEKLAQNGCGDALNSSADDVLARLEQQSRQMS